ncbi:Cytochrome c oxidase subunit 3 [wastewater metagenome]|uniref:Cytochrome c oxidase subunit 3 n=2 Tax=unclassified sequences TaxID=12908 RepID=A0A5B8RHS6_9ZZZZ|nr:cytochrome c oxidase subunit 3 [Arhodomonas sp. KWT]QEA07478.1 cytochrome c oxidase subunit 3 [uncultured organism]
MSDAAADAPRTGAYAVPGDLAMWWFILAELAVFGALLASLIVAGALAPEVFAAGRAGLHPLAGLANTVMLLTGSYLVARGIDAAAVDGPRRCAPWFLAATLTGTGYVAVKLGEYADLVAAGYNLRTSTFHFFYFFTTVFHLMHVVLGMIVLVAVARRCRRGDYDTEGLRAPESAASYWHMVDLVWLALFPLLYVLP